MKIAEVLLLFQHLKHYLKLRDDCMEGAWEAPPYPWETEKKLRKRLDEVIKELRKQQRIIIK